VRRRYAWLLLLTSIVFGFADVLMCLAHPDPLNIGDPLISQYRKFAYLATAQIVLIRAIILGLSTLHVRLRAGATSTASSATAARKAEPASRSNLMTRLILSVCTTVGSAFFVCVVYNMADERLGFILAQSLMSSNSTWFACLGLSDPDGWSMDYPFSVDGYSIVCPASPVTARAVGLHYYASFDEMQRHTATRFGKAFYDLKDHYNDWWQLTFARYYE
jgi:hypothetical protein